MRSGSMTPAEKIKNVGIQAIACDAGVAASTAYRWYYALRDGGSVKDDAKRKIIAATANSEHPVVWADFA